MVNFKLNSKDYYPPLLMTKQFSSIKWYSSTNHPEILMSIYEIMFSEIMVRLKEHPYFVQKLPCHSSPNLTFPKCFALKKNKKDHASIIFSTHCKIDLV